MPTFVALLRGIDVGKAKRVSMAELRALLSGLSYTGVATLLNSGNAFRAPRGTPARHSANIAAAIPKAQMSTRSGSLELVFAPSRKTLDRAGADTID